MSTIDTNVQTKKTPVVTFRALEPEDLEELYLIENDRELWDAGSTNVPYSKVYLMEYILSTKNDIYADRQLRLMAEREGGRVVGIADLTNYDPRYRRAEVGIVVKKAYRSQGYATEILRRLLDYADNMLQLKQIYAIVSEHNTASIKAMERAGFQRSALLKDWLSTLSTGEDALLYQYFFEKR